MIVTTDTYEGRPVRQVTIRPQERADWFRLCACVRSRILARYGLGPGRRMRTGEDGSLIYYQPAEDHGDTD